MAIRRSRSAEANTCYADSNNTEDTSKTEPTSNDFFLLEPNITANLNANYIDSPSNKVSLDSMEPRSSPAMISPTSLKKPKSILIPSIAKDHSAVLLSSRPDTPLFTHCNCCLLRPRCFGCSFFASFTSTYCITAANSAIASYFTSTADSS